MGTHPAPSRPRADRPRTGTDGHPALSRPPALPARAGGPFIEIRRGAEQPPDLPGDEHQRGQCTGHHLSGASEASRSHEECAGMNEEDKAQKLSEAIDALLEGREPEVDDKELQELLSVARLRLRAGQAMADVGKTYQDTLRRAPAARMRSRQMKSGEEVDDPSSEIDDMDDLPEPREFLAPLEPDYGKREHFLGFLTRVGG